MKRVALVSTTLLLLCFSAPAQTAMPDDGLVKDGVYFNRYFGFGFTYPKDWVVRDQATNDRIHERAREEAAKTGTLDQAKVTYPLLSVTRHPNGTPGISMNPVVFVAAERIAHFPHATAKEYLLSLRGLKAKRGEEAVLKEPAEFRVAGLEFLRDDYRAEVNGVATRQSIFVTLKKGYAVVFSFRGADEQSVAEMAQTMNTILPLGRGGNIPLATPAPRQ
jgi:hypothetical protein